MSKPNMGGLITAVSINRRSPYCLFSLLLVMLVIVGCASVPKYQATAPEPLHPIVLEKDEVLIFGKILFIDNGKLAVPYSWPRSPWWVLERNRPDVGTNLKLHKRLGDLLIPGLSTHEDGSFYYKIPVGHYVVMSVALSVNTEYATRPMVQFDAQNGKRAVYVGTLQIDINTARFVSDVRIDSINVVDVTDDFEGASAQLLERYTKLDPERIVKRLLHAIPMQPPRVYRRPGGISIEYYP